jgi:hypothetical protein
MKAINQIPETGMTKFIAAFSMAAVIALAGASAPAFAQPSGGKPVVAKKHHTAKKRVAAHRGGRQIACTFMGCAPVPRGCTPVTEYNWDGAPTGFDAVACR